MTIGDWLRDLLNTPVRDVATGVGAILFLVVFVIPSIIALVEGRRLRRREREARLEKTFRRGKE